MNLIIEGIIFGFTLSFLLGPIFLVLIHSSIQHGKVAGLISAAGVWVSDFLFIAVCYLFIQQLQDVFSSDSFMKGAKLFGSFVIMTVGVIALFVNKKIDKDGEEVQIKDPSALNLFMRGFLINTINPFTVIFWLGVMGGYVIGKKLDGPQSMQFFAGILIMIIVTDYLKVILAHQISKYITQNVINKITKIAGIGLIIFGIYLLVSNY